MCGEPVIMLAVMARTLVAAICCSRPDEEGRPCGECDSCERITRGTHPALVEFFPEGGIHRMETLRNGIQEEARLAPPREYGFKMIVIHETEKMREDVANAFLKTLEEPPQGVVFCLLTNRPDHLLTTIRSRCTRLSFTFRLDIDMLYPGETPAVAELLLSTMLRDRLLVDPALLLDDGEDGDEDDRSLLLKARELSVLLEKGMKDLVNRGDEKSRIAAVTRLAAGTAELLDSMRLPDTRSRASLVLQILGYVVERSILNALHPDRNMRPASSPPLPDIVPEDVAGICAVLAEANRMAALNVSLHSILHYTFAHISRIFYEYPVRDRGEDAGEEELHA